MRDRFLLQCACVVVALLSGCTEENPCLAAHRRVIRSPSDSRAIDISTGPCPNSVPMVGISFDHGSGGGSVFAVDDSMVSVDGRWIGEDTAEISYPASAHVSEKKSRTQYGQQHVTIVYVVRPDSGR